jgi:hypothetical protein
MVRLWSIHPRHLDAKGLVALWREGLLARAVLRGKTRGKTRGYRHHPQLERFRRRADPVAAIDAYLRCVCNEAVARGYRFDRRKLGPAARIARQAVHAGQIDHEWKHLLAKLRLRDRRRWSRERNAPPACHPCFRVVTGGVEPWERGPRDVRAKAPAPDASSPRRARAES